MVGHSKKMKALLVNLPEQACGVAVFGRNLYQVLKPSQRVGWHLCEASSEAQFRQTVDSLKPDAILYNWQPGQGGYLAQAPFPGLGCKQVLSYHDLTVADSCWDAILFSDPTMQPHDNWHSIGRPLPVFTPDSRYFSNHNPVPTVGCYGFMGAWANQVVEQVLKEFEFAKVRLNLPFATYGDAGGGHARAMADLCGSFVMGTGITIEISHDFLPQPQLLDWLSKNDLNCFFRPVQMGWRGVSSAPDSALAVRRPIAVNRCSAFRHLHNLNPSICIEDSSLTQIVANGLSPLVPLYAKWDAETVRAQVEDVITGLVSPQEQA